MRRSTRALAGGINWIDTAALYGNGASEETIGRHIDALEPQPAYLDQGADRARRDERHPGRDRAQPGESLKRLQLERVALFQLHNQLGDAVGDRPALTAEQVLGPAASPTPSTGSRTGTVPRLGMTAAGETGACLEVIESGRFDCCAGLLQRDQSERRLVARLARLAGRRISPA